MIEEKTCQKCGANLKYDAIRKTFACPFCGTTDQKKATLQEVDEAIANSAFSMAKTKLETLKEESPDDPSEYSKSSFEKQEKYRSNGKDLRPFEMGRSLRTAIL